MLSYMADHVHAIAARLGVELEIGNHQTKLPGSQKIICIGGAGGGMHLVSLALEVVFQKETKRWKIVDHENVLVVGEERQFAFEGHGGFSVQARLPARRGGSYPNHGSGRANQRAET